MRWVRTLLNAGVGPVTNETIIPREAYDTITRGAVDCLHKTWFKLVFLYIRKLWQSWDTMLY